MARPRPGAQQAVQLLRQEEGRLDVEVHDLVPAGLGEIIECAAPGDPGIVDPDIQPVFPRGQFGGKGLDPGHCADVGRQGHAALAQFGSRGGQILGLAGSDVDPGATRRQEAFGDHPPDAARSPGDERHAPFQRKQAGKVHRGNPFAAEWPSWLTPIR